MSSLVAPLDEALRRRTFVRIHREPLEAGWLDGRVLAVSRSLVLLAVVSDAYRSNGLTWLRLEDVSSVEIPSPRHDTIARSLRLRGERLATRGGLDVRSFASALEKASRRYGLVTIHQDVAMPGTCDVGEVRSIGRAHVTLRTLDPDACWDDGELRIPLADITRVDAGGEYEAILAMLAKDHARKR